MLIADTSIPRVTYFISITVFFSVFSRFFSFFKSREGGRNTRDKEGMKEQERKRRESRNYRMKERKGLPLWRTKSPAFRPGSSKRIKVQRRAPRGWQTHIKPLTPQIVYCASCTRLHCTLADWERAVFSSVNTKQDLCVFYKFMFLARPVVDPEVKRTLRRVLFIEMHRIWNVRTVWAWSIFSHINWKICIKGKNWSCHKHE